MSHRNKVLSLGVSLLLTSCAAVHAPLAGVAPGAPKASATLMLTPQLQAGRYAQAVLKPYTASDINRLDVIPYLETSPGVFQGMDSTGAATDSTNPDVLLKKRMASPSIDFDHRITLGNLAPDATYRIFARAYDAQGTLISTNDSRSYVDLTVTNDDRPTMGTLPIKLVDTPFSGSTTVALVASGGHSYDHVVFSTVTVVNGSEVPIDGATTQQKGFSPSILSLTGLQPNTTYRVKASVQDAGNSILATASTDINVTNDTAPPAATLSVSIPYAVQTLATGFDGASGVVVDKNGDIYASDSGHNVVRKISAAGNTVFSVGGFVRPGGVAVDGAGNLSVADYNGNAVKRIH